jgi:mannitol 2-dehydrogenase
VRIRADKLASLPATVRVPGYDRAKLLTPIVHIGVGGFFRAHQAVYLDDLLLGGDVPPWGACGVGLLDPDIRMRDALRPQDFLYTLLECERSELRARVIGSMPCYLFAPENPDAVIERMSSPETRIVSLTITEGGYYFNHGTGGFDRRHPDIVHDLANPGRPRCSFGFILEALDRRRRRGLPAFTVMSCDNLQQNGDVARRMFLEFAALRDTSLCRWIEMHCAFPNSMVDRITPMTDDVHREVLRARFGIEDAWPVITEPFRQWVIEDRFTCGRPPWERAGALMTSDVLPYEKIKIRLLNAGHQALCHVGRMLGFESVHQTIMDPQIRLFIRRLMDGEISPLLQPAPGMELEPYKETLLARFSNPAINDKLSRIAMETSVRMPKFLLPSISEQLARGGPVKLLCLAVACWFRSLTGKDEQGRPIPLVDPVADVLREKALRGGPDPHPLLTIETVFDRKLADSERFTGELTEALGSLYRKGIRATLEEYMRAGNDFHEKGAGL